ncbi:MAG: glycosyltransferase [bacterium]|nr:MAG: glycosyltransferase [bacterium]
MEKKKNILMIAYYFPPLGGSGALRPFKLAKYLPLYGWTPIVLTAANPDWYYARDPYLLFELPMKAKVFKSFMFKSKWFYRLLNPLRNRKIDAFLRSYLIQPDGQVGWIPFAYSKALQFLKKNDVHVIYSTSAPLSCHLIAYLIKKKSSFPWVADFRDEWFENPGFNFPTHFHRRLHYKLEGMIVRSCDKVMTAAPVFNQLLAKHCNDENKFSTITMGFDPDDFTANQTENDYIYKKQKFTITFSGLFYKSFKPTHFVKAAQELIDEGKISSEGIKIQFIGANSQKEIGIKDNYGICEFTGFVDHKKSLRYLKKADALLLLLSKERGKDVIPSKTFEYIATGKPILAIVPPEGEIAKIIIKYSAGIVADYENHDAIKNSLYTLYNCWKAGYYPFNHGAKNISEYSQIQITEHFAHLIEKLLERHSETK